MLEELRYFIRESGATSAAINGISTPSKLCKQTAFNLVWLNLSQKYKDENISVAMSNVACTGQNPFWHLVSADGTHRCLDNIGAQRCVNLVSRKSANV